MQSDSIGLRPLRPRTANPASTMERVGSTSSLNRAASRAAQRRQFLAANGGAASSSLSPSPSTKGKAKERDSDADADDVDLLGSSSAPAGRDDETRLLLGDGEGDGDFDTGWQNGAASSTDVRVRRGAVLLRSQVRRHS